MQLKCMPGFREPRYLLEYQMIGTFSRIRSQHNGCLNNLLIIKSHQSNAIINNCAAELANLKFLKLPLIINMGIDGPL